MDSPRKSLISLQPLAVIVYTFFVISPVFAADSQTQALIDKICRNMEDYGFCNRVYQKELKGGNADMHGLAQIAQETSLRTAAMIRVQIIQTLEKNPDKPTKDALETCQTAYDKVIDQFQQAWFYFKLGSYKDVVNLERTAPKAHAECNPTSDLADPNTQQRILIAMALVSTNYLI